MTTDADRVLEALVAATDGRLDEAGDQLRAVQDGAASVDGTTVLRLYKAFMEADRYDDAEVVLDLMARVPAVSSFVERRREDLRAAKARLEASLRPVAPLPPPAAKRSKPRKRGTPRPWTVEEMTVLMAIFASQPFKAGDDENEVNHRIAEGLDRGEAAVDGQWRNLKYHLWRLDDEGVPDRHVGDIVELVVDRHRADLARLLREGRRVDGEQDFGLGDLIEDPPQRT